MNAFSYKILNEGKTLLEKRNRKLRVRLCLKLCMSRLFLQHRTDAGWFHVDQNPRCKPNRECVQGLVNLLPVTPKTGGNVLVQKSHEHFPLHYTDNVNSSLCHAFYHDRLEEIGNDDWMEIDPNDIDVLRPDRILACLLGPGDMLLWDSRVVHCSYPGKNDEKDVPQHSGVSDYKSLVESAHGLIRAGVLVSMMARKQVDDSVLQERRHAVDQCQTLTHWANKVAPLGEERPDQVAMEAACLSSMRQWQQTSGTKVLMEYDDLTMDQRQLVVGDDTF